MRPNELIFYYYLLLLNWYCSILYLAS